MSARKPRELRNQTVQRLALPVHYYGPMQTRMHPPGPDPPQRPLPGHRLRGV